MKYKISLLFMLISMGTMAQVYIQQGSVVHLQENAGIYVQGDLNTSDNISGKGSVVMIGDSIQAINANGFSIPVLSIQNNPGVSLAGDLNIVDRLSLIDGNLVLNKYSLSLNEAVTIEGANEHAVVTNASGVIRKFANKDIDGYFIPLSNTEGYTPIILSTRGTYQNGFVELSAVARPSEHKPSGAGEYLNNHWRVVSQGIDGTVDVTANTRLLGNMSGYLWQEGKWNMSSSDAGSVRATIKRGAAEIYAMSFSNGSLQPNPAINSTTLVYTSATAGRTQLTVSDARGRIVQVRTVDMVKGLNRYTLNLGNLTKGYYDVGVLQQGKKTTLKLVRQ